MICEIEQYKLDNNCLNMLHTIDNYEENGQFTVNSNTSNLRCDFQR